MNSLITSVIGQIPNRLALTGGWIDQPFVSRHNPKPSGSIPCADGAPVIQPGASEPASAAPGGHTKNARALKGRG